MKKNIYLLLFLLIFIFSFFVNKQTIVAAGETITLERIGAEKNSQTNKWDWRFSITTTGGVENSDIWMKIYTGNVTADGSNLYHQETAGKLKDNKAEINTDFILEDNQIYSISFTINMKPVLHAVYKNTTGDTQSQGDVINFTPQTNTTTNKSDVYTLLAPIGEFRVAPDNIGEYFNVIFLIAIGLCGVLAVIMIVIGGIQYMGDESVFGKTQAKERITKAILGLIIALGAFALLNTINPELLGGGGVNIKQVSAEIIDLPDAGDGTVDPDFKKGKGSYSTDASVSPGVTAVVNKLQQGWELNQFRVYTNNRMLISIKKGTQIDNSNVIDIKPGINGYAESGTAKVGDKKTPVGSWKILSIKTSPEGQPVYNKSGANMGASFWLLSPMSNGERGIGMHGNKNGTLSGTYGCIRLKNADLLALLPYVKSGITVNIGN